MADIFGLAGKTAIVTGGSRGIGKAIAAALAEHGANVVIADVLADEAGKAAKEIKEKSGKDCLFIKTDVSSPSSVNAMVKKAKERYGSIDILINNAGILKQGPLDQFAESDWDKVIAVNLKGQMLCAQAAGREMLRQKGGNIVNIASVAGLEAFSQAPAYNTSKGGVVMLTKSLAYDWASHGVRVNAIAPGVIETPMTKGVLKNEQFMQTIKASVPSGRVGRPAEIANAALFLASDMSSYVNGHVLVADGGWTCHL